MKNSKLKLKIQNLFVYFLITVYYLLFTPFAYANGNDIVGEITPPGWMKKWGPKATEVGPEFGLIIFFSNILKLLTVVAGLFAMVNLILAGLGIISASGEPEKLKSAQSKIWNSLIGLVIIAASFTIAAIVGWIFFGDATMIIKPKIWGVGGK